MYFNEVLFSKKTRNLFQNKTSNPSLLPIWPVSASQGPVLCPAQSIQTGPGTSLCSFTGPSLPSSPHSLFLLEPFQHQTRNLNLLPAQTVSSLPGLVAEWRHMTVTPNPGLVNPESFVETSRSAGALICHLSCVT